MTEPKIYVRPTAYDVGVWPDGVDCIDASTWTLTVDYRGRSLWGVFRGKSCLGADGQWEWEPIPSSRDDEWLSAHRFPLDRALELAREHAPGVRINGMTAVEALAYHQQNHPGGSCLP